MDATKGQIRQNDYLQAMVARQTVVQDAHEAVGVLKVGSVVTTQARPFRYYNENTKSFEDNGFEYQLMQRICREMRR